jgi:hypothetical protein
LRNVKCVNTGKAQTVAGRSDGSLDFVEVNMLRRFALIILILTVAPPAAAASYNDIWYNPVESGWGVQVVQSNTFQFLTLFIYGTDGKPTWYTAHLTEDATGNYSGQLYATTGTFYASAWNPAQLTVAAVGTASFAPSDPYQATLVYALTGGPTVTKTVQRQTLTPSVLTGHYSGSLSGSVTGCTSPADNKSAVRGRFSLEISQVGDESATLTFSFVDTTYNGIVCTLSGPLTHIGSLYRMADTQYSCTGQGITPGTTSAIVERFHGTQQGVEGRWTASAGGCTQAIRFAAVEN